MSTKKRNRDTPDESGTEPEAMQHRELIDAVNTSGFPLEFACADVIRRSSNWTVGLEQYSIQFGGEATCVDVVAERQVANGRKLLLLIEIKRALPEYKMWAFLPSIISAKDLNGRCFRVQKHPSMNPKRVSFCPCGFLDLSRGHLAARAVELGRKRHQNGRPHANTNTIEDACHQVELGCLGLCDELVDTEDGGATQEWCILPVIVTTADLRLGKFDATDVSAQDGRIDADRVALDSVPYVYLSRSVRLRSLEHLPSGSYERDRSLAARAQNNRLHVLVVRFEYLPDLLRQALDFELKAPR